MNVLCCLRERCTTLDFKNISKNHEQVEMTKEQPIITMIITTDYIYDMLLRIHTFQWI